MKPIRAVRLGALATLAALALGGGAADARAATPAQAPQPGAAASWGENYFDQLGTLYKDTYETVPVGVEGLTGIVQVAGGSSFDLALLANGTVASWGGDEHGELGDDSHKSSWEQGAGHVFVQEESPTSHEVLGSLQGVASVAAANEHAIVLMDDGTVRTWGNDQYGQLGDGTQGFERVNEVNQRLPKPVPGLSGIRAVAAGGGSDYALTAQGTVVAWGRNTEGQLGNGVPGPDHCETVTARYPRFEYCSERPVTVTWRNPATHAQEPLSGVRAIAAGAVSAYALLDNGHVVAWGSNHHGQLGTGAEAWNAAGGLPPAEVRRPNGEPLGGVVELAAGSEAVLARLADGEVLGWGDAAQGELAGVGTEACRKEPAQHRASAGERPQPWQLCARTATRIPALERLGVQQLSAGQRYGLALSDGGVYAWGSDEHGELGLGRTPKPDHEGVHGREAGYPTPTRVLGIGAAQGVLAAPTHGVVLLAAGVNPPAPLITVKPGALQLQLSWRGEAVGGSPGILAQRLLYRRFERTGEVAPAEEGVSPDEEGAPLNLPAEPPTITLAGEQLEGQPPVEGHKLLGEPGGWSGGRPIVFTYQWQRCNAQGEACADIAGASHGAYLPVAADVGQTLRLLVTATGAEGQGSAFSEPTPPVEAARQGETRKATATSVSLKGLASFTIQRTVEQVRLGNGRLEEVSWPLQPVPYEIRLSGGGRARVMALTPLP